MRPARILIELTRDGRGSPLWFVARRGRVVQSTTRAEDACEFRSAATAQAVADTLRQSCGCPAALVVRVQLGAGARADWRLRRV